MPDKNIASLGLFQAKEHQPFLWETDGPAVLLIHGFMGTPAEMRPLGEAFRQSAWSVQGLLLPGFGSELDTLFEQNLQDWIGSAESALLTLRTRRRPVVLVGYSMGAAVALNIAAERPVDGLILLALFWRIGTPVQRLIWQVAKQIFRRPKPFKRANFADPRLR
ncbi:MAG: alpha/beta fold hydrolase, partial [Chloroflexota bacterium]